MGASKFTNKVADALPAGFTASLDEWLGVLPTPQKLPDDPDDNLPVRAHDKIAAIGTAVFEATNWLQTKPTKYDDVDHATFARDGSGKVIPAPEKPTSKIWVTFSIPNAPMPAGGYPAVVVQHGLSGSRAYLLSLANRFASKGWIAVAIVGRMTAAPPARGEDDCAPSFSGGHPEHLPHLPSAAASQVLRAKNGTCKGVNRVPTRT
jgi:hypothetical protein